MNNSDIIGSNADKTQNNKNDKSFNSYFFFISYLKGVYVVVEHHTSQWMLFSKNPPQ